MSTMSDVVVVGGGGWHRYDVKEDVNTLDSCGLCVCGCVLGG